jgi:hypothetical protein
MKRKIFFYLFFLIALFLVAEIIARAYYYGKPAEKAFASYQLLRDVKHAVFPSKQHMPDARSEYFIRPNISKAVNDTIAMETQKVNNMIYQPWIAFSSPNGDGRYVSVTDRVRNSMPSAAGGTEPDTTRVWFLGGSTMFGLGVTDAETIPAAFVKLWQQRVGRPISVMNYATPLYYSYQELMVFADKLFRGNRPQIVIMLDGLNDGAEPYGAYLRNPYNAPIMQQLLNPELYHYKKDFSYSGWPDSPSRQKVCEQICENYLSNIANMKKLADEYHVQLFCFWQPIPYYNYINRLMDPVCAKGLKPQYDLLYPRIQEKSKQIDYLYYLGDMVNEMKLPFMDSVHYTPAMNEAIAKSMLDSIATFVSVRASHAYSNKPK